MHRASSQKPVSRSLFEEAIILGKIRSAVKAPTLQSRDSQSSPTPMATFKNGVAFVRFGSRISADSAAAAIKKIMDIDSVDHVRADFSAAAGKP